MVRCQTCGAQNSHYTRDCPSSATVALYAPLVTSIDPDWILKERNIEDPQYRAWLRELHMLLRKELDNLKSSCERLRDDIELEGTVKEFMHLGWRHGPYVHDSRQPRPNWKQKWVLKLPEQGDGRVWFVREKEAIHFEDTNGVRRMLNANNFFTSLLPEDNVLKKIGNAIRDYPEWKARSPACTATVPDLAKRVLEVFPEVEYRRNGPIEVFLVRVGRKQQGHDAVYHFISEELHKCIVSEDANANSAAMIESERSRKLSLIARAKTAMVTVAVLRFHRTPQIFHDALLSSSLAKRMEVKGLATEPPWANGAKIFVAINEEDVPVDVDLRQFHVILDVLDIPELDTHLKKTIPCKQRPLLKACDAEFKVEAQDEDHDEPFAVVRTFIHYRELPVTPRSTFTMSCNDAEQGYVNPRSQMRASEPQPDSHASLQDYVKKLKASQRRLDLHEAVDCYSSMRRASIEPNAQVFTILIDICGKTGECEQAVWYFDQMQDVFKIHPPKVAFHCLIHAFAPSGNVHMVETWLRKMQEAGYDLEHKSYNGLIRACSAAGCVEEAQKWFDEAKAQLRAVDVTAYRLMMELYANKAMPDMALHIFEEMEHGPQGHDDRGFLPCDAKAYKAMIVAYAKCGNEQKGYEWCCRKEQAGFGKLGIFEYSQRLYACAPQQGKPADPERGGAIFKKQLEKGIAPSSGNLDALAAAVGQTNARKLCAELNIDARAVNWSRWM